MVHKACPLAKEEQPHVCRDCPMPHQQRLEQCNFYKGQVRAGVPWWRSLKV